MKPDDAALIAALEATVVVMPSELPCLYPQTQPCRNLGLLVVPEAGMLPVCQVHFDAFYRPFSTSAQAASLIRRSAFSDQRSTIARLT